MYTLCTFFASIMPRKPVSLCRVALTNSAFTPPVTGLNGDNRPVSNLFDGSGTFRHRSGSGKRARTESEVERDAMYDLSRDFPPLYNPDKPALDPAHIKTLLVTATAAAAEVTPLLEIPETSPPMRSLITLTMTLLQVLEAVVERGIEPLASAAAGGRDVSGGRAFAKAFQKKNAPPLPLRNLSPLEKRN